MSRKTAPDWVSEFPAAVTVCDIEGTVLSMNARACATFRRSGGRKLVGRELLSCHPAPARAKLEKMLREGTSNAYTIEKAGKKKLIYQAPWKKGGRLMGLVEISIVLPDKLPHFIRK